MPNSFGTSAYTWPIFSPAMVREHRQRFRLQPIPELNRANGIWISGGRWPSRGYILLSGTDYADLQSRVGLYGTDYHLDLEETQTGRTITLRNLCIVQARCVTSGVAGDGAALYLVELTDRRGLLWNPWFQQPTASYYNVPAPAYPGEYYYGSLNNYAVWSWADMIRDLWEQQQTPLGEFPGLPINPEGPPEGFIHPGVSSWMALNRILELLGCTIAVNLASASPYTIASYSAADASFASLTTANAVRLEDDWQYIDVGAARVPKNVVVHFHRRNQYYGTEETLTLTSYQWQTRPLYTVSVDASAQYAGGVGTHFLWDDFQVRYDTDGNPVTDDAVKAKVIARERAGQYYAAITRNTSGFMHKVYAGLVPFVTGSQVDGVCFRRNAEQPGGWRTEIVRGMDPPWEWMK